MIRSFVIALFFKHFFHYFSFIILKTRLHNVCYRKLYSMNKILS